MEVFSVCVWWKLFFYINTTQGYCDILVFHLIVYSVTHLNLSDAPISQYL